MSGSYFPPAGPPPNRLQPMNTSTTQPQDPDSEISNDPPPAYTPSASISHETSIQAGPSHMEFDGPPPMPDRFQLEQNITGVGMGYGPRASHSHTGFGGGSGQGQGPFGDENRIFGGPPSHPSRMGSFASPSGPPPPPPNQGSMAMSPMRTGAGGAGPSRIDTSPTEVPTPGRPLLFRGQLLVYPKGHFCPKCECCFALNRICL